MIDSFCACSEYRTSSSANECKWSHNSIDYSWTLDLCSKNAPRVGHTISQIIEPFIPRRVKRSWLSAGNNIVTIQTAAINKGIKCLIM